MKKDNSGESPKKAKVDRTEKEVIKGEIVRVRRGNARTNKPVKLPDNPTWLKQSNIITLMSYDFKTLQIRVLIALIEKIQNAMEESINNTPFEQLTLFSEFNNSDKIHFAINYRDLGVEPYQYSEVKAVLKQLATIPVEFDAEDPITKADSWVVAGLFKAYIPKATHQKQFTIEMEKDVAKAFVNVDKGFTRFIKEIAYNTQSKYTVRMYLLISSWKDKGGFSIYTDRFRHWLKLEDKYPKFKDLYKRIIKPVYDELFEKANCWFEMAEVYREGESEPYKLNFKVVKSALSKQEEEHLNKFKISITNMLSYHLRMEDKHIKKIIPLVNLANATPIMTKISDLKMRIDKDWSKIKNIPEYCVTAILKDFDTAPGIIGSEEEVEEMEETTE